jgi:putative copper resistance protein D
MDEVLIAARAGQFAAAISLCGVFAFLCLVAGPAFRQSGDTTAMAPLRRRLDLLAWASLALALVSGAAWLVLQSAMMSGQPVGEALAQGVVRIVLTRTRFGEVWLLRCAFAAALALWLLVGRQRRVAGASDWTAFALSIPFLTALAWVGHAGATPGAAGLLHLSADILHLLAAGIWLGMLIPLALLLAQAQTAGDRGRAGLAWAAVVRFSALATASVAVLLAAGIVNTWFLAGSAPALIGTLYGRLLLLKVAIFLAMLLVAAVNRWRISPRLATPGGDAPTTIRQLRRNALIELGGAIVVLGIVGALGLLPPGLHSEPVWPLPFRLDFGALSAFATNILAGLALLAVICAVVAVALGAAGPYRRAALPLVVLLLSVAAGSAMLRKAAEPAYPTSFYISPEPYAAPSVARGMAIYAANCAACHGAEGHGDGPSAAGPPIRPADLTASHLLAHPVGDLFWRIGHSAGHPNFAKSIDARRRWDLVNFIRARAAGSLARKIGPQIGASAAYPVPDFAFETAGKQQTLSALLEKGPVLLVLFAPPAPAASLTQLAEAASHLEKMKLAVIAVEIGPAAAREPASAPEIVTVADSVRATLALFAAATGVGELLLDRAGNVRARWVGSDRGGLADIATLAADAARVERFAAAMPRQAGHMH